jgi:hypothetical protein
MITTLDRGAIGCGTSRILVATDCSLLTVTIFKATFTAKSSKPIVSLAGRLSKKMENLPSGESFSS